MTLALVEESYSRTSNEGRGTGNERGRIAIMAKRTKRNEDLLAAKLPSLEINDAARMAFAKWWHLHADRLPGATVRQTSVIPKGPSPWRDAIEKRRSDSRMRCLKTDWNDAYVVPGLVALEVVGEVPHRSRDVCGDKLNNEGHIPLLILFDDIAILDMLDVSDLIQQSDTANPGAEERLLSLFGSDAAAEARAKWHETGDDSSAVATRASVVVTLTDSDAASTAVRKRIDYAKGIPGFFSRSEGSSYLLMRAQALAIVGDLFPKLVNDLCGEGRTDGGVLSIAVGGDGASLRRVPVSCQAAN